VDALLSLAKASARAAVKSLLRASLTALIRSADERHAGERSNPIHSHDGLLDRLDSTTAKPAVDVAPRTKCP